MSDREKKAAAANSSGETSARHIMTAVQHWTTTHEDTEKGNAKMPTGVYADAPIASARLRHRHRALSRDHASASLIRTAIM